MKSEQKINHALARLECGSKTKNYSKDRDASIAFIFRCDMTTAQKIVNRVSERLYDDNSVEPADPILVLKTADPDVIAECLLEELEPATAERIYEEAKNG